MDEPIATGAAPSEVHDLLLNLNFVPQWARQSPQANPYARHEPRDRRPERDARAPRRSGPPRPERDRRDAPRGPRPAERGERRGPPGGDRNAPFRQGGAPRPEREPRPAPPPNLPLTIAFIPERERLAALVHDLHVARRAWSLADIAHRFLANLDACLVKIEIRRERGAPVPNLGKNDTHLFQCLECQALFTDPAAAEAHAVARHLDKMFLIEELLTDPPAGTFACIARCRRSGELLGPPNHHGYQEKLLALHRERYAHLSVDDYRNSIETVRDPALIEKWKEESRKQTVYKQKGVENPPALKRAEAEALFREKALPGLLQRGHRFIVAARGTQDWEDERLRHAIHDAWQHESRFPASLIFALRPAFKHMHLYLFKVGGGITFVTPIHPHPLAAEHTVAAIRGVLEFLHAHPGCTRQQLLAGLQPGAAPEAPEVVAVLNPLRWLIDRGHVIEFFNGTLAVPLSGTRTG
jgi:hypothetical protein